MTASDQVLRVASVHPACDVLGPGRRFVLWVQGCPIGCRGCVSPQWIPEVGGSLEPVDTLAARIVQDARDGVTFSGGEPFAQAPALVRLVEQIRQSRDISVLSYTGYTLEHLLAHGDADQRRLLSLLDILVDGPYLAARHADLRWRGSSNQRVRWLSDRHIEPVGADCGVGLQVEVDPDGSVRWLGAPPVPGFRERFERELHLQRSPDEELSA